MAASELVPFLERCSAAFEWWNGSAESDQALADFFATRPHNKDITTVLEKVSRLDKEYATRITTIVTRQDLAQHIVNLKFPGSPFSLDERLVSSDPGCVGQMELISPQITHSGKEARLRSFATKYCHFSRPEVFPIYDAYADTSVTLLRNRLHFSKSWPKGYLKMDYSIWMGDVYEFRGLFVPGWSLKKLDQALWYLGATHPDTKLDPASKSTLIHRVMPIPALLGITETDTGWPCLTGSRQSARSPVE